MLLFAIGFNLWLYRLEPTATVDPNDNAFQFALVDRTNTIWDFANKKCSSNHLTFGICHFSFLIDHWVHNWAEGYNLPYYYSHIPQIAIVASYRFLHSIIGLFHYSFISLFQYYHIVIYLLLSLVPIPVFLALRVIGLPWLTVGLGALFATHLSTDGLYGLDPSSFLWRGYGLSSQLFAMIWLPLALAYSYRYFAQNLNTQAPNYKQIPITKHQITNKLWLKILNLFEIWNLKFGISSALPAIFFVTATTAGHLGIGMITMLSLGFLAVSKPLLMLLRQESIRDIAGAAKDQLIRLIILSGISIFLLSYWIVPTFVHDNYHNISFWDPVWKFDSYGWKETMIRLFNGDLFDFGRWPYLTMLILLGVVIGLFKGESVKCEEKNTLPFTLYPFSFLFIFWLLFYFGRTTWGGLIDLIPGMKEFHLSRFLVGLHVTGMLLAPIGLGWIISRINITIEQYNHKTIPPKLLYWSIALLLTIVTVYPVYQWTVTYNELNDKLIVQANNNHKLVKPDEQKLFAKLRSLPGARIFAGRGGGFGKEFRVAETPYYMHLSTYGLPTTLWLPETWSMNSDTEQYFSEGEAKDYDLYNMRWVAAPPDQTPQPFWTLIDEAPTWKLYEVPTSGYFTPGIRPAVVSTNKRSFINTVHLWIQSDAHKLGLFPQLTFDKAYPKPTGLPNFKMLDEVTYITPDNKKHNIWTEPPVYLPPGVVSKEQFNTLTIQQYNNITIVGPEKNESDMVFGTTVNVGDPCVECMVILKQTYHPNWRATVDGKSVKPITVFPFYIGIPVSPGTHEIVVSYQPSTLKIVLLVITILTVAGGICGVFIQKKLKLREILRY